MSAGSRSPSPSHSMARTPQAVARNSRAVRIGLLVAGLAGQLAVAPLLPFVAFALGVSGLLVVSVTAMHLPIDAGTGRGRLRWNWQWRQVVALVLIVVPGILAMYRLHPGDAASEAQTLALMLVFVQIAHTLASSTRREVGLGCTVVVAMFAVAVAFAGDVIVFIALCAGLAAIAVTGTLLRRAALLESADGSALTTAASVVRSCVAAIAVAIALGAVVFLMIPNSDKLRGRQGIAATGAGFAHGDERATAGLSSSTVDLRARGPLSNAAVFSTSSDAPPYWQGAIYDSFDGTRWTAPGGESSQLWQLSNTRAGNGAQVQLAPASTVVGEPATRTDDVTMAASAELDVVLSPGLPLAYAGPGRVISNDDGSAILIPAARGALSYQVASAVAPASDAELRAASGPDPTDPRWTAVPATIAPRVGDLARRLTATSGDRFDAVNAIEDYLRNNEKYDLDSPEPARGDDAVDDFLFVSHRGFCEQFATAAVVMLRSVGVPARLVTGYAFGETTSDPGRRIFRGSDAHAWVQVYYPGVGWVDSDPTASQASSPPSAARSIRQRVTDALGRAWHRLPGGRGGALLVLCLVLAVSLSVAPAAGRRLVRRRRRLALGGSADGPVLAAYLRLEAELVGSGRSREPEETFGEFARRLGGLAATPLEVANAMALLERECYARESRRPSAAESASALEVFERLRAAARCEPVTLVASSAAAAAAANRSGEASP
jgi:protein-glutamine gamma-glutamyltransferase